MQQVVSSLGDSMLFRGRSQTDRKAFQRLRRAAFDPTKTLEGFDFSFNSKLNKILTTPLPPL